MQPIGVGIVGAGFSANQHAGAYHCVTGVPVKRVGVVSRTPEKAAAFAKKHGFEFATTNLQELLSRPDVHVIDICAPNFAHEEIAIAAARAGKHIICEKPLTAYFGDPSDPARMREEAMASVERVLDAVRSAGVLFMYAENWIYAPAIQKALRLAEAAGGTIFDIRAEEAHSGSHSPYAREWRTSGGGSLLRLGSHPLAAALYFKRVEGERRDGKPIRVASVSCEATNVTRIPSFEREERKWVASGWKDVEDWATLILNFEDGARATISASDIVLGGIRNRMELYLSNARIDCNLNPNTTCVAYAPASEVFADEYIAEKTDTKAGWSFPSINEDWLQGYPQEVQDFLECIATGRQPLSDAQLAADVVAVTYAAYQSAREGRRIRL